MEEVKKTFVESLKDIVGIENEKDKNELMSLIEKLTLRKNSLKEELKNQDDDKEKTNIKDMLGVINNQIKKCEELLTTKDIQTNELGLSN